MYPKQKEETVAYSNTSNEAGVQSINLPIIVDRLNKELAYFEETLSRLNRSINAIKQKPSPESYPIKSGSDEGNFIGIMDEHLSSFSRKNIALSDLASFLESIV